MRHEGGGPGLDGIKCQNVGMRPVVPKHCNASPRELAKNAVLGVPPLETKT